MNYENLNLIEIKPKFDLYLNQIKSELKELISTNPILSNKVEFLESYLLNKYDLFNKIDKSEKDSQFFLYFFNTFSELYCFYKSKSIIGGLFSDFEIGFNEEENSPYDFYFMVNQNRYNIEVNNKNSIKYEPTNDLISKDGVFNFDFNQIQKIIKKSDLKINKLIFSFSSILLNNFDDMTFKDSLLKIISQEEDVQGICKDMQSLICELNKSEIDSYLGFPNRDLNKKIAKRLKINTEIDFYENENFGLYLDFKNNIFCEVIHSNKEINLYKILPEKNKVTKMKLEYLMKNCKCCANFVFNKKEVLLSVFNDEIKFNNVIETSTTNTEELKNVIQKYFNGVLLNNY